MTVEGWWWPRVRILAPCSKGMEVTLDLENVNNGLPLDIHNLKNQVNVFHITHICQSIFAHSSHLSMLIKANLQ